MKSTAFPLADSQLPRVRPPSGSSTRLKVGGKSGVGDGDAGGGDGSGGGSGSDVGAQGLCQLWQWLRW